MRFVFLACLVALQASLATAASAQSSNCTNADPSSVLAGITGDFEFSIDPQDPAHLIFTSNVTKTSTEKQNVVVAQVDGQTGEIIAGTLTTVADNFEGDSDDNGPSWMDTPQGQLGLIFVGKHGVHGVYRSAQPAAWNDFLFNYDNTPSLGSPSVLPNTGSGEYPGGTGPAPPTEAATYPQYMGVCTSLCYAAYNAGLATDVQLVLTPLGYKGANSTQGVVDGSLYISACLQSNKCGLFQAKIDGAGGLSSFQQIASTGSGATNSIAAIQHPVTGTTVIFTNDSSGTMIKVWEQKTSGGMLTSIGNVQAPPAITHFRPVANPTEVVLNYFIRGGRNAGSYTLPVTATGSTLTVGTTKMIGNAASGTEFDWLPAANQWAYYYRKDKKNQPLAYFRCWVTP